MIWIDMIWLWGLLWTLVGRTSSWGEIKKHFTRSPVCNPGGPSFSWNCWVRPWDGWRYLPQRNANRLCAVWPELPLMAVFSGISQLGKRGCDNATERGTGTNFHHDLHTNIHEPCFTASTWWLVIYTWQSMGVSKAMSEPYQVVPPVPPVVYCFVSDQPI